MPHKLDFGLMRVNPKNVEIIFRKIFLRHCALERVSVLAWKPKKLISAHDANFGSVSKQAQDAKSDNRKTTVWFVPFWCTYLVRMRISKMLYTQKNTVLKQSEPNSTLVRSFDLVKKVGWFGPSEKTLRFGLEPGTKRQHVGQKVVRSQKQLWRLKKLFSRLHVSNNCSFLVNLPE